MNEFFKGKNIALVTDWLTNLGGAEKVVKAISDVFPEAPIYTTVVNYDNIGDFADRDIRPSFLQKTMMINKKFQLLLPWFPRAVESLDLSEFDIVISFSSSVAKGVLTNSDQLHVCYIHSPMRYAWEPFFDDRFKRVPRFLKPLSDKLLHKMRIWDYVSAVRPDVYIANSRTTQGRIKKYYRRDTQVLYPPVKVDDFEVGKEKGDYYLGLGRMVHYKRFDLLVKAFQKDLNKKLVLIGDGSERDDLELMAQEYRNIKFVGEIEDEEVRKYLCNAKALLLPQKEDAGIVQLEAFSAGVPVIAYKAGGILDVLEEGTNGIFFDDQTPESLLDSVERFEGMKWDKKAIRNIAKEYDTKVFQQKFLAAVEAAWEARIESVK